MKLTSMSPLLVTVLCLCLAPFAIGVFADDPVKDVPVTEEAATEEAADDLTAKFSPPEKLIKADIEEMLQTLSNDGRWGEEDELGTLNLITPEKRIQAAGLVQDGVSVSMAHDVVKIEMDGSKPFEHTMMIGLSPDNLSGAGDRYSVEYHGFAHTHIDALCHMYYKNKMYNGFSAEDIEDTGSPHLGINVLRNGIFTRAVLMDMPALFGVRYLEGDTAITPEHLDAFEEMAGVRVESGDALLINTGRWTRREIEGEWKIEPGSAGLHASCLPWIKERDVSIIGSDLALDVLPSQVEDFGWPVHAVTIVGMGMCILDVLDFREVAELCRSNKRWTFLLTVAPLPVEGGTGSPINPLATF